MASIDAVIDLTHLVDENDENKAPKASELIDLTRDEEEDPEKEQNRRAKRQKTEAPLCPVCKDDFVDAVSLQCSHTFCQSCIDRWLAKSRSCPVCRTKITSEFAGEQESGVLGWL